MLKYNQVIKMTIQHLICFIVAARAKSFSVAAQGLFMSQPTFGRQIASMEQELGYPLFIRTTKGNVLTPGGQILASVCRRSSTRMKLRWRMQGQPSARNGGNC